MVVAKHDASHAELARQFEAREVEKEYVALVWGVVQAGRRIDAPLGRDPVNRQRMSTRARRARSAVTRVTKAEHLLAAYNLSDKGAVQPAFQLAIAYLRLGEAENCLAHRNPKSCILPIRGGGIHREQTGARKAIEYSLSTLGADAVRKVTSDNCRKLYRLP